MAASPSVSLKPEFVAVPGQTSTFLLFHGFFFFEIQGTNLVIASPKVDNHSFKQRDHGAGLDGLLDWDGKSIDGVTFQGSGMTPDFPVELLQF